MILLVDSEFESLIPALQPEQLAQLRANIIAAGRILDPIKVWLQPDGTRDVIIDGHNRYHIYRTSPGVPLPEPAIELVALPDRDAVKEWMRANQRGRRNLSPDQQLIFDLRDGITPAACAAIHLAAAKALIANAPDLADQVAAGTKTIGQARADWRRTFGPPKPVMPRVGKVPATPRGPSGSHATAPPINLAEGQELRGQSTLINESGELTQRWDKSGVAPNPAQYEIVPEGHHIIRTSTFIRADGQIGGQHISAEHEKASREKAKWEAWARHAELYAGLATPSTPPAQARDEDLIALYPLGDPHIGMLAWALDAGENFDLKIALRELLTCVRLMVEGAPPAKNAIVCNLGDFLHAQSDEQRTPGHGHKLDVDGRYAKVLDAGHVLLRGIVDAALEKHEHVTIRNLPGNHDPQVAAELAMWLRAVYEREPRVTVADAFASYQFDRFGTCLFGWAHGDGAKAEQLPLIMANSEQLAWGATTERVWHTGHVHHLSRKEFTGCVVETHRTMAGKDFWHASKGYSAKRSLQMIAYHRIYGEISRNTVGLTRVREAIKSGVSK